MISKKDSKMRISSVSIENLKCFKTADIEFGKLTLLTGANSSGKSSILYSILGALQSVEFPFQLSPNGKYVTMGNFQEMSYKHLRENIIKIGFKVVDEDNDIININTWWEEDKIRRIPKLTKLQLLKNEFKIEIIKKRKYTLNYRYFSKKDFKEGAFDEIFGSQSLIRGVTINVVDDSNGKKVVDNSNGKKVAVNENDLKMLLKKMKKVKKSVTFKFDNIDELVRLSFDKGGIMLRSHISYLIEPYKILDKKINFISSFRLYPERTYYEKSETDLTVGKFGEYYVHQIILWETQKTKEYKELIGIMRSLSLLEEIESKRLEGGRFELDVKINEKSVPSSLNDVGFGISQFLPIVVSDLQLGERSTLFVAQPEIHLHPSVQAQFGDYMVNQINQCSKNYIIETHSEYLLNRIRLDIVKKKIAQEDVKVYYLQNDGEDTKIHQLEFTKDGQILNAPKDFFKTYMMDVMNIAVNANANEE